MFPHCIKFTKTRIIKNQNFLSQDIMGTGADCKPSTSS